MSRRLGPRRQAGRRAGRRSVRRVLSALCLAGVQGSRCPLPGSRRRRGWGTRGTEAAPLAPPDAPRQPQGQCSRRTLRNRLHLHDVPSRTRAVYRAPFPLPVAGSALTPRVKSMSWRGDDEDGPHAGSSLCSRSSRGPRSRTCVAHPPPGRREGGRAPSRPRGGGVAQDGAPGAPGRARRAVLPHVTHERLPEPAPNNRPPIPLSSQSRWAMSPRPVPTWDLRPCHRGPVV